jgi:hypothetical protein
MFSSRWIRRAAIVSAVACASLAFGLSGVALAGPIDRALAQEQYYMGGGQPDSSAAIAQERYYSSYGEPEPLTLPQPAVPSDHTPWLPIALSLAAALAIVALSATQLRRLRHRRRTARATT